MDDFEAEKAYIEACGAFVNDAAEQISFGLITSDKPETEREIIEQVAYTLAGLASNYEEAGMGELEGTFIIDDLAARALAIFKALGMEIEI